MKIKRKTLNRIRKIFLLSFLGLFIVGIIYSIFGTQMIRITSFDLVGVDTQYKEQITGELQKSLWKKFLFVPTNNMLTYRSSVFQKDVSHILTNAESIHIRPESLHTLRVTVTGYAPLFRTEGNYNAVSDKGVFYSELHDISGLPLYVSSSTQDTVFLSELKNFIPKVEAVLFHVDSITIDGYDDVYVKNATTGSFVVFKESDNIDTLWLTLISAIDTTPLKDELTTAKDRLQYIDLRFGNKVFYKFTNGGSSDIIATSTESHGEQKSTTTNTGVLAEPHR